MKNKTIGGIEFEAVPINTRGGSVKKVWRAKVIQTGTVLDCISGRTRPLLWDSLERTAKILGDTEFTRQTLLAN